MPASAAPTAPSARAIAGVEGNTGAAAGTATAGVCQATSDRFGCHATVVDGKVGPTLCID